MSLGVLTLATQNDYRKAIGLALSLRVSNPSLPIAVACSPKVRPLVSPYFNYVVNEDPSIRGFLHKLHLDRYSPFQETFYFDSDVLVFRALHDVLDDWRGHDYTACGNYVTGGVSPFGLDRDKVLAIIGSDKLVHIDGAGHAYFRKPECHAVFDQARNIAANYQEYAGDIKFADEDVMDIVMTLLKLRPMPHGEFWSRYCSGKRGSVRMNAVQGECCFEAATTGQIQRPHMMHFAANEAPFAYTIQLMRLFRHFDANMAGLLPLAISDYYVAKISWPAKALIKRLLSKAGLLEATARRLRK